MSKEYAPAFISAIVIGGFVMFSFLAMKPEYSGVKQEVVLFLLGAWSTMSAAVVNYWVGSSAGSKNKDEVIAKQSEVRAP